MAASFLEQATLRAAWARAQAAEAPAALFDIVRVAPGIYAAIARTSALINCNAAIFENEKDLLIVDSHSKGSAVGALVAQIRKEVSPKPVRYVVNTHFHDDHVGGSPAYRRIAPQADILSSTATRQLIERFSAARIHQSVEATGKAIDGYQQRLSAARTPVEKSHWQRMLSESRAYMAEMKDYTPELPNVTFDQHLVLHDKAHELHLYWRGRGHTAGDVVVFSPEKKVIATGDLLHGFLPYMGDCYPRDWPRTLKSLRELGFEHVIGGHGPVQHSGDRLSQMAAYLSELTEKVAARKESGRRLEQIQEEVTPASLRSLDGGYGDFVAANHIRYDPDFALATPAEALAGNVRSNVADTFRTIDRT